MNVFTMIVLIVAIGVVGDIIKRVFDIKKIKASKPHQEDIERLITINETLNTQVKELESRIVTLEKIVTEDSYDLKQTINNL